MAEGRLRGKKLKEARQKLKVLMGVADDPEPPPKARTARERYTRLMERDLAKSGIPLSLIPKLGLRVLTRRQTEDFMTKGRGDLFGVPSYEIPYFDAKGRRTGYSRLKNLDSSASFTVGKGKSAKKKSLKYLQRPNTPPHLYIPPIVDWPRNEDGKIKVPRLVITEGEKKAMCACERGIFCVALGGVDAFRSSKRAVSMLAEFSEFDLSETIVEICYDSDTNTNPDVARASSKLASELLILNPLGLNTAYIDGETTDDGKLGLDDYLIQYDKKDAIAAFDELRREEDPRFSKMHLLSRDLCYLTSVGKLYNIPDDRYYDGAAPLIVDYGPKLRVTDPDNPQKQIPAVKLWLETRNESTYCYRTIYEPGKPLRYREPKQKLDSINVWKSSDVTPIEGDVSLWTTLVRYIMGTDEKYAWFLKWLAYPLQNPGAKLFTGVFVYSFSQGIGKNFVIDPLIKAIYGSNYQLITSAELESEHNAWACKKQFIFGEEIWMSDKRDRETTMGKLKSLVTNDDISVREKYRPLETFANKAQYYFTANQPNALALDEKDRRFFVVHAPEKPLDRKFYKALHEWSRRESSPGKVLSYLLNQVDCTDFEPTAQAPMTNDKQDTIEQGRDSIAYWVNEIIDNPAQFFEMNGQILTHGRDLYTAAELLARINSYAKDHNQAELRLTANSLARYLAAPGKLPYRRVKLSTNTTYGLYAVFNREHWKQTRLKVQRKWGSEKLNFEKSTLEWKKHYEGRVKFANNAED